MSHANIPGDPIQPHRITSPSPSPPAGASTSPADRPQAPLTPPCGLPVADPPGRPHAEELPAAPVDQPALARNPHGLVTRPVAACPRGPKLPSPPPAAPAMAPAPTSLPALGSDSVQRVLAFLPLRDRAALLASTKTLHDSEPLATHVASFCGRCDACADRTQHLCASFPRRRVDADFWLGIFSGSQPTGLTELRLAGVNGIDVAALLDSEPAKKALPSLRVLDLHQCPAFGTQVAFSKIAELCTNLVELHLRDMPVDSSALACLLQHNASTLRVVDLLGCHTITGEDVRTISSSCKVLRDLSLWGCHNVDNASIIELVQAQPGLRRLNLRYVHRVDDRVVAAIANCLHDLKDLNLRYCFKVSDVGVAMLCDGLPLLERLNLSQCTRISDVAIARIAMSMSNLKELRLWGCTRLTSAAVRAISMGLPALTLVDIRSRDRLEAIIGGQLALKFLIQTYRNTLAQWEQALGEQDGVFKRQDDLLEIPA